jgi:hypothetical protein
VQIIESTSFGVRSVVFTLEAGPDKPHFLLFPMVHMAEPEFYSAVQSRLDGCDLVLFEGAPTMITRIITLSYRLMAGSKRLGLVYQGKALAVSHFGARAIRADISSAAFKVEWRRLPLPLRALLLVAAPLLGLHLRFFGSREQIAGRLGTDLLPSRDDILVHEFIEPFHDLVLNARDRILERHLAVRSGRGAGIVGVVYGAKHMRAVIKYLTAQAGYRITGQEFLTVMSL